MNQERFKALRETKATHEFWYRAEPKCPHCGYEIDIHRHEMWELFEGEGDKNISCPHCEDNFEVSISVSYSFSTDEQDAMDDED